MREYGKVYTAFWTSEDVSAMTEDERTLALYLLTCPHGNMLGCFRLPEAYASDDLRWEPERVSKGFIGLVAKGYLYRCDRSSWVVILRYLKWNQFENPNVGKAAGKLFEALPAPVVVKAALAAGLREFSSVFPFAILDKFEAENKPFRNPLELSPETGTGTGTGTGEGTVTETHTSTPPVAEAPGAAIALARNPSSEKPSQAVTVRTIFEFWQKVMDSPRSVLDDKRRKVILRALRSYSPADICKAIRGCSKTPHNMGQNASGAKYNGLDLILRDADHIDRFMRNDDAMLRSAPGAETVEQANERIMRELLGETAVGGDVIDMGAAA